MYGAMLAGNYAHQFVFINFWTYFCYLVGDKLIVDGSERLLGCMSAGHTIVGTFFLKFFFGYCAYF
jgi:hypothetical protein